MPFLRLAVGFLVGLLNPLLDVCFLVLAGLSLALTYLKDPMPGAYVDDLPAPAYLLGLDLTRRGGILVFGFGWLVGLRRLVCFGGPVSDAEVARHESKSNENEQNQR